MSTLAFLVQAWLVITYLFFVTILAMIFTSLLIDEMNRR